MNKNLVILISIVFFVFLYLQLATTHNRLYFVDAGRFAIVARSLLENGNFLTTFNFYTSQTPRPNGWVSLLPPVHILAVAFFMKIFGIGDQAVIYESFFFFFFSVVLTFLLGQKLFGKTVGIFSAFFLLLTPQFLGYARDGASEPIFMAMILGAAYALHFKRRWALLLAGLFLGLMLFTKLQAYFLVPLFLIWAYFIKRKLMDLVLLILPLATLTVLNKLGLVFPYYSIWIPAYLLLQQSNTFPGDNITRSQSQFGTPVALLLDNSKVIFSKFVYNLYNFVKIFNFSSNILPVFTTPFLTLTYIFSNVYFFIKEDKLQFYFRIFTITAILILIILASLTSPEIRYIQIMLPFVIILSVDFLVKILKLIFKGNRFKIAASLTGLYMIFFAVPLLGNILLDSRFNAKAYNLDKPYVQKLLGKKIGELAKQNDIVVTNLDTWGSWYGSRKTILIPVDFIHLETLDKNVKVNKIFLTDYQRDNEDHPLNGDWGMMFDNPADERSSPVDKFILDNFILVQTGTISADLDYEKRNFTYKLWQRK